jgi:isocitrate dehydrogenase (NAD+)
MRTKKMGYDADIEKAKKHFGRLIKEQLARIETMMTTHAWIDYSKIKPIIIGIVGGDGIGPIICEHARRVLEFLLKDELHNNDLELRVIEGLTS